MSSKTWSVGRSVLFLGVAFASAIVVDQMVGCMSAAAQQKSRITTADSQELPATADDLIRQMARSAGVIFVGQVVRVRHPAGYAGSPQDAAEGVVEIDFRVDYAVRGGKSNSIYTLREWAGLWAGGIDRYCAGQRLLMLLRSPDANGFSSPVHGAEGAIPLRGTGNSPGPDESSTSVAQWMVDVRWLQAQVLRTQLRIPSSSPILRKKRYHSEGDTLPGTSTLPFLVRALPGPWLEQTASAASVESLTHVLSLCMGQVEP